MRHQFIEPTPSRSWTQARLGRIVIFVMIVWAIAGSFLILQEGLPMLVAWFADQGSIPDSLLVPGASVPDCTAAVIETAGRPITAEAAAQVRLLTWRLGFELGFASGIKGRGALDSQESDVSRRLKLIADIVQLLGVTPPRPFDIRNVINALSEFRAYVESDPDCVAAQLSKKYEPSVGPLYKFSLIVGYAAYTRIVAPPELGPLFVPQMRFYGEQAKVPRNLWEPFSRVSLDSLPGDTSLDKIDHVVNGLTAHMKTSR